MLRSFGWAWEPAVSVPQSLRRVLLIGNKSNSPGSICSIVGAPDIWAIFMPTISKHHFFLLNCLIKLYDCRIVDILTDQTPLSPKNSVSRETDEMGSDGVEDLGFTWNGDFNRLLLNLGKNRRLEIHQPILARKLCFT